VQSEIFHWLPKQDLTASPAFSAHHSIDAIASRAEAPVYCPLSVPKERERSTETYPSSLSGVAALSIGVVSSLAGRSSLSKAESCTFAPRNKNRKIQHDLFT
jgi:hypothetical protein